MEKEIIISTPLCRFCNKMMVKRETLTEINQIDLTGNKSEVKQKMIIYDCLNCGFSGFITCD